MGHAVEDGDEGRVVLLGAAQQVPGHGVGVAGGGGDHDPDVGGADELGGEYAVVGDEGVDVGRVEEGEPAGQVAGGLDAQDVLAVVGGGEAPRSVSSGHCGTHTRVRSGRTRAPENQRWSSGWQTSTGVRVVGRSTPASLTFRPTRELTRVDFPAPVDPPITASKGASGSRSRGTR